MIKPELEQSIVSIDDVISLDDNEDPASADEMEDSASVSGVSAGIYLSSTYCESDGFTGRNSLLNFVLSNARTNSF